MSGPSIAAAPVSWGVFDADSDVDSTALLDDIARSGYAGTELGPPGYLGNSDETRAALRQRGLELVGSFLPLPFSHAERREDNRRETEVVMELLERSAPGSRLPTVLLSDAYSEPERIGAAGRVQDHPEVWLSDERWSVLLDQVNETAAQCRERGFEVAFHPHGGSYVETPDEIARLLDGIDTGLLGLCLDTGHAFFGGADPLALLTEHGELVTWVHLKDVDLDVLADLKQKGFGIDEAWRRGVFCELGHGGVDLDAFLAELGRRGYDSWIVVEQDRILLPGADRAEPTAAAERNRRFLTERGL